MKRIYTAIVIGILGPLLIVTGLYLFNIRIQPKVLDIASETGSFTTSYFDEKKLYSLSGDLTCFPNAILVPSQYTFITRGNSTTFDGTYADMGRENGLCVTISSFTDIRHESFLSDGRYSATIGCFLKLPSNTDYAMWFPASFCEYKIYVNTVEAASSKTFGSSTPVYPHSFYVTLPASETGYYEVVACVSSPENYINTGSESVLIGTLDRVAGSYDAVSKVSLFFVMYILFTIIFILIQIIVLKNDPKMIPFICLSGTTAFVMSFLDGRCVFTFIPSLSYQAGFIMEAVAIPLYLLTLLFFSSRMYREYFPYKVANIFVALLTIPFIDVLTLKRFPVLTQISNVIEFIPYLICLYLFVKVYEKKEPNALVYGISIISIASSVLLYVATSDMAIPSRFTYSVGYSILSVMMVSILAGEYVTQDNNENFYSQELSRQLEAMQASENAFLNAQMKPHFLYNTLNTIADCCVTDSQKAKKLINSLSEYLKLIISLDNMDKTVPIRHELELVEAYTAIEKERFPNINFYTEFPMRMPVILMPPITIQPLIENAIKHGVRKLDKPGVVTLRIVDNPQSVDFFVSDNGVGMTQETIDKLFRVPKENQSIGIYNIDKRLKNQYKAGLHVESTPGLGTCISFSIPKAT